MIRTVIERFQETDAAQFIHTALQWLAGHLSPQQPCWPHSSCSLLTDRWSRYGDAMPGDLKARTSSWRNLFH